MVKWVARPGEVQKNSVAGRTYKPSTVKRLFVRAILSTGGLLSATNHARFYEEVFTIYRVWVRLLFLRFVFACAVTGNRYAMKRTFSIFRVMPYSLVGWKGLVVTYDAVSAVLRQGVEGALVECGVAQGGCAALMSLAVREANQRRKLWLFDTYEGLPAPTEKDFAPGTNRTGAHIRPLFKGSCLGTYEQVKTLLVHKLHLEERDIVMVKGLFQDTLAVNRDRIGCIAVLRLDGDWYESTKCCLESLYDYVVPNGVIIIDDYGACFGAQKATDEFLKQRGIEVDLMPDGRGGVCFVKPG
jgi:hypothetical protein